MGQSRAQARTSTVSSSVLLHRKRDALVKEVHSTTCILKMQETTIMVRFLFLGPYRPKPLGEFENFLVSENEVTFTIY